MKRFFITFVSAFAVLAVVSAVSCSRDDAKQQPQEPNREVIAQCVSNMGGLFAQLNVLGAQVQMGTRAAKDGVNQAELLIDELSFESQIFLKETGWTDADLDEVIDECGDDIFATLGIFLGGGTESGLDIIEL